MNPHENRPIENLLEGLSQHSRFLTREERKTELRERGIDVDGFLNEAHSLIAHHQKEERLAWMKIADEKRQALTAEASGFDSWLGKGREVILTAFQNFLNTALPKQTIAFRNKTDLTVDDMARILDDHERLCKIAGEQKPPQEKR